MALETFYFSALQGVSLFLAGYPYPAGLKENFASLGERKARGNERSKRTNKLLSGFRGFPLKNALAKYVLEERQC